MTDLTFDDATLDAAERLFGVRYTDAERAQMRDNLGSQVELAVRRRAVRLPNALPPATLFDPRLPGFSMPAQPGMNIPRTAPALPETDADIAFAPVRHLSAWIAGGQLSSVRLTRIYLDRIRRHDPALFSFATVTDALALAQAKRADALLAAGTWLGPLHGIPYGGQGHPGHRGHRDRLGRRAVRPSRAGGRMPRSSAGSPRPVRCCSARPASARSPMATSGMAGGPATLGTPRRGRAGRAPAPHPPPPPGLVGFAIGTETLGSIVSPAARCGATGLRPTFGRVSRAGAMALCWSLDKIGPICRAVDDTALVLAAINGFDPADDGSIAAPFGWDATRPPPACAWATSPPISPMRSTLPRWTRCAASACAAIPLALPDLPYDALRHLLFAEAAAAFEELTLDDTDDTLARQDPGAWPNSFRKARFLSAVDHIQLDRLRRRVMQEMDALFRRV